MSARLVLGSITALDERELPAGNLPHLLARSYIPEAHLSGRTCGVSTLARPAKLIIRLSTQDWQAGLGRRMVLTSTVPSLLLLMTCKPSSLN